MQIDEPVADAEPIGGFVAGPEDDAHRRRVVRRQRDDRFDGGEKVALIERPGDQPRHDWPPGTGYERFHGFAAGARVIEQYEPIRASFRAPQRPCAFAARTAPDAAPGSAGAALFFRQGFVPIFGVPAQTGYGDKQAS